MPEIKKVKIGTTTYDIKDEASGYGTFSAAQGSVTENTSGAVKVATLSYRNFNTSTGAFAATTTVDFYSTPGAVNANPWSAYIDPQDNTNLIFELGEFIHVHSYEDNTPTYTWASDYSTCTASVDCDGYATCGYTLTETVNSTSSTSGAVTTYTATFSNSVFTTQTHTEFSVVGMTVSAARSAVTSYGYTNANNINYKFYANAAWPSTYSQMQYSTFNSTYSNVGNLIVKEESISGSGIVALSVDAYKMPDVVGMDQSHASDALLVAGFGTKSEPESDEYVVITQSVSVNTLYDATATLPMIVLTYGEQAQILGTMPSSFPTLTTVGVLNTLASAGILSATGTLVRRTWTVLTTSLTITKQDVGSTRTTIIANLSQSDTISYSTATGWDIPGSGYVISSITPDPLGGSSVYDTDAVTIRFNISSSSGGGGLVDA